MKLFCGPLNLVDHCLTTIEHQSEFPYHLRLKSYSKNMIWWANFAVAPANSKKWKYFAKFDCPSFYTTINHQLKLFPHPWLVGWSQKKKLGGANPRPPNTKKIIYFAEVEWPSFQRYWSPIKVFFITTGWKGHHRFGGSYFTVANQIAKN